jgi:transposase
MIDGTTLLFALPGFRVLNVTAAPDGGRLVLVESVASEGGCPSCGVLSSRVKDRPICLLKDLPHGSVPLTVWVCKRRFVCTEKLCSRRSFTEVSDQIPARSRLTTRLRTKVSAAVTTTNRAMSEVAGSPALNPQKTARANTEFIVDRGYGPRRRAGGGPTGRLGQFSRAWA